MLNITVLKTEINGVPETHQGFAPSQIVLQRDVDAISQKIVKRFQPQEL